MTGRRKAAYNQRHLFKARSPANTGWRGCQETAGPILMTQNLRHIRNKIFAALSASGVLGGVALANNPVDGGISLLPAKSAIAQEVHIFHNWILMPVMTGISLFVLALLLWVIVRYNAKANPTPSKFSHNTLVEVLWTGIPIIILLFISLFSFDLLYKEDVIPDGKQVVVAGDGQQTTFGFANDFSERRVVRRASHMEVVLVGNGNEQKLSYRDDYSLSGLGDPEIQVTLNNAPATGQNIVIRGGRTRIGPQKILGLFGEDKSEIALAPTMTLKVTGYQWNWSYSYPDFDDFEIFSKMLTEEQTTPDLYRFAVDNPIYVPVGESIRVITTAADVIHSWAMPNFAIKIDAVPGRLNETWFNALEEGTYYGQCSEICGIKHSFMPIEVRVVSKEAFVAWVDEQRALNGLPPLGSETASQDPIDDAEEVAAIDVAEVAASSEVPALETAELNVEEIAEPPVEEPVASPNTSVVEPVVAALPEALQRCEDDLNALVQATKISFQISSATIDPASYGVLEQIASVARDCNGAAIEIGGHTDSTGSEETNQIISAARAQAVADFLAAQDVGTTRLTVQGYGPGQPIASNATREGRAQNRRIEFSVTATDAVTAE